MKKNKFEKPELEIFKFDVNDIITTSNPPTKDESDDDVTSHKFSILG